MIEVQLVTLVWHGFYIWHKPPFVSLSHNKAFSKTAHGEEQLQWLSALNAVFKWARDDEMRKYVCQELYNVHEVCMPWWRQRVTMEDLRLVVKLQCKMRRPCFGQPSVSEVILCGPHSSLGLRVRHHSQSPTKSRLLVNWLGGSWGVWREVY